MDAAGYLDRWLAGPRSSGVEVKAVLGYCVGAVYAAEAAGRIARWQPEPPALVLLDPEPAVQLSLYSQFHNVLNLMGTLVPAERIAVAHQAGRLAHDGSGDMDTLAAELIKIFEGLSTEALSQAGLDEISRRELTGTFVAFMTYLTMAGRFDPFPAWREATALSSSSPGNGLNAIRAYSQGAVGPLVAKELRFATDHIDLLRSPDVAAAVSDLLNG
ncbi:hypothetical protein [Nonomuraea sp. NPDC050643]|uniref:hypothetical protein n=1 Tax=Nonomuraea sp. NPDC050643 TaxID=3155660 RepID=UPI0033E0E997